MISYQGPITPKKVIWGVVGFYAFPSSKLFPVRKKRIPWVESSACFLRYTCSELEILEILKHFSNLPNILSKMIQSILCSVPCADQLSVFKTKEWGRERVRKIFV